MKAPAIATFAAAAVLLGSSTAQAGDEFERAFKSELGRIAAHEAVYAGRHFLASALLGYGAPYGAAYPRHGHGHHRHHRRHWRHHPRGYPPAYGYGPVVRHHHHHEHHHEHHHYEGCGHGHVDD